MRSCSCDFDSRILKHIVENDTQKTISIRKCRKCGILVLDYWSINTKTDEESTIQKVVFDEDLQEIFNMFF